MSNNPKRPPMMPGPGKKSKGEKPKEFKKTVKKLSQQLIQYKWRLIIVLVFAIGSTIFSIVGPKILGNATTEIFEGVIRKVEGTGGIDFNAIGAILITLLILYIISATFSLIQGFTMTSVAQKLTYKLRNDLATKVNKLPMNYFDKRTKGDVLSVITNDIDTLSENLNQSITQVITSICTVIGIAIMMFSISWEMTLTILVVIPISFLIMGIIIKKSQKYFTAQQQFLGNVNGQVEEIYGGHNVVKAFNGEADAINNFKKANEELYKSAWKSQFLAGIMHPITHFIGNLGYVIVAILGGYLAIQGRITVGNIQSFIQYTKQFTNPISQIAQVSSMIQSMIAAAERIFEFLDQEEELHTQKRYY